MTEKTTDSVGKGEARRRLLRGTFAAPAVLTMYSGGALAQTSASCLAKAQANPVTGDVVQYIPPAAPPDTYLRVRLWRVPNNGFWLRYEQISDFAGATDIIATNNNYRRFIVNTNELSTRLNEVNVANPGSVSISNRWAALRFDATGRLVGVGASGGGSAITGSCWTSTH